MQANESLINNQLSKTTRIQNVQVHVPFSCVNVYFDIILKIVHAVPFSARGRLVRVARIDVGVLGTDVVYGRATYKNQF